MYDIRAFVIAALITICLCDDCSFINYDKDHDHTSKERITPLKNKTFSAKDNEGQYSYEIGICKAVGPDKSEQAGAVQYILGEDGQISSYVILGTYKKTEILAGREWTVLEYRGGKKYGSHCNNEERRALVMITCDEKETQGKLEVIDENTNKSGDCYYLFELSHQSICIGQQSSSKLSSGSIVCIVFVVVGGLYILGGVLYQRFVHHAQGKQQIPNYEFWQDIGNLAADGCEFVFRSKSSSSGDRQYRGIGDDQLHSSKIDDPPSDTDEHLLPM